jgi:chromosome transmission fidelity protein 18
MSEYSPYIPTSFDPALYLHSEADLADGPSSLSHSDELEALQQCTAADKAEKSKRGIVIQHRAWITEEVFRSEEDHPIST